MPLRVVAFPLWVALPCPFGWSSRLASPFGACSRSALRASPRCEYPGLKNPFRSMLSGFGTIWSDFGKKSNFEIFDFFSKSKIFKNFQSKKWKCSEWSESSRKVISSHFWKNAYFAYSMHIMHILNFLEFYWYSARPYLSPPTKIKPPSALVRSHQKYTPHTLTPHSTQTHISQIYCVDNK